MVVDHDREPGSIRFAAYGTGDEDVEFGVIGLPDLVGPVGSAQVYELVSIAIRNGSIQRERYQCRVEGLHDISDSGVAGHQPGLAAPLRYSQGGAASRSLASAWSTRGAR